MTPTLRRIAAPAAEPITLAEAKAHLRVDATDDDYLITLWIQAAREAVEAETGRCLLPQDWQMTLPEFPSDGVLRLQHAPLVSVTSVATVDAAGTATTLAASAYQVLAPSGPGAQAPSILPAAGTTWPTTVTDVAAAVRVIYRAGYASVSEVPAALRAAVLLMLGDLYANREAASVAKITDNPAACRLIWPFRLTLI